MDILTAVLAILVAIGILFEVARRIGVPYPTLLVLGGLGLAFVPGLPLIQLEPELVLLVFLPPLLFGAAVGTPIRELRANLAPLARLSIGLVIFTMVVVAIVAQAAIPSLGWAAAFALGAIVAPTDALAATTVFRRLGAPRVVVTLIEGEALFNDATALVAYRAAVFAVAGSFVLSQALAGFAIAAAGGIVIGVAVGWVAGEILRRLDDPPVEVLISLVTASSSSSSASSCPRSCRKWAADRRSRSSPSSPSSWVSSSSRASSGSSRPASCPTRRGVSSHGAIRGSPGGSPSS